MKRKYRILVTGCGGDIGQSIGKILKLKTDLFSLVIGADVHDRHPGKFIYDNCYKLPVCDSDEYQAEVKNLISEHSIDLIIPVSEAEIRFLHQHKFDDTFFGIPLVIVNNKSLEVGLDKKLTADFLKSNGLPYPKTYLLSEYKEAFFPVLIKSRNGSGGKSIHIVNNNEELVLFQKIYPNFIAQEFLVDNNAEFTCGLFRSSNKITRSIIFRRNLLGGFSSYGIREQNPKITELLNKLAVILDLTGSINVQLRLVDGIPIIFEINPRFSSTVLFRHLMDFEDLIWVIKDKLFLPIGRYNGKHSTKKFYKGFSEYVE